MLQWLKISAVVREKNLEKRVKPENEWSEQRRKFSSWYHERWFYHGMQPCFHFELPCKSGFQCEICLMRHFASLPETVEQAWKCWRKNVSQREKIDLVWPTSCFSYSFWTSLSHEVSLIEYSPQMYIYITNHQQNLYRSASHWLYFCLYSYLKSVWPCLFSSSLGIVFSPKKSFISKKKKNRKVEILQRRLVCFFFGKCKARWPRLLTRGKVYIFLVY